MKPDERGRCWHCGYELQGIPSRRCPECGRPFDPADPRTMHMGRYPIGRLGRKLIQPPRWWIVGLAGLATFMLIVLTGVPSTSHFRMVEWPYYFAPHWLDWAGFLRWKIRALWLTPADGTYIAVMAVWAAVLIYLPLRLALRGALLLRHRVPRTYRTSSRRRLIAILILFGVAVIWQGFGWPNRMARHFVDRRLAINRTAAEMTANLSRFTQEFTFAIQELTQDDALCVVRFGITHYSDRRRRTAALALLVEQYPGEVLPLVRELIPRERDRLMRLTMLRLLAMGGKREDLPRFLKLLDSSDADEREVSLDFIGLLGRGGQPPVPQSYNCAIDSSPPIYATGLLPRGAARDENVSEMFPPKLRDRLWGISIHGATPDERAAAAQSLVALATCPLQDPINVRVAEWGVWLADGAQIKLAQSVLDEIPPFVHRIGDSTASMKDRIIDPGMITVTKPVIHLTATAPLYVNLEVKIRYGRPWFAYPGPDDFTFEAPYPTGHGPDSGEGVRRLSALDPRGFQPLGESPQGIPWLLPHRETQGAMPMDPEMILSWGVRWQTMLLTPDLRAGMRLADVPDDPRFQWWKALRNVPSCYVTSGGETERFIYYDGPTNTCLPVRVGFGRSTLTFTHSKDPRSAGATADDRLALWNEGLHGMYIEVGPSGARAALMETPADDRTVAVPPLAPDGSGQLLKVLTDAGLTAPEAGGLIASWEGQFFKTPGRRFLLFLSGDEYDAFCPLEVTPTPSAKVRVGIVLFEFPAPKPAP